MKRRTHDDFVKEVLKCTNDEYSVLGIYKNSKTKILMKHNNPSCSFHEYLVEPTSFLLGTRCPKCGGTMKKSHEQFVAEVYDLVKNEYTVIEKYINNRTKILMKHHDLSCNFHEYYVKPNDFLSGYRCPKCFGTPKKSQSEFCSNVFKLVKNEYSVVGEYIKSSQPILIKHNICDYEYYVRPAEFIRGSRCPKCSGLMKKTYKQFCTEVFMIVGDEYSVLGEYKNCNTPIQMKHNKCGHVFFPSPKNFLSNCTRCPKCSGYMKLNIDTLKDRIFELVKNEYEIIGNDYKSTEHPIKMKHINKSCSFHEYSVTPHNFFNGTRCPKCNESKGERRISDYLKQNNIIYKQQYSFNNLRGVNGGKLKFDFAVFENKKLFCLIEYDGIFHFTKQYKDDGFEKLQYHDKIKNEFCKNNDIRLLRIPYMEIDNLEQILENQLQCLTS